MNQESSIGRLHHRFRSQAASTPGHSASPHSQHYDSSSSRYHVRHFSNHSSSLNPNRLISRLVSIFKRIWSGFKRNGLIGGYRQVEGAFWSFVPSTIEVRAWSIRVFCFHVSVYEILLIIDFSILTFFSFSSLEFHSPWWPASSLLRLLHSSPRSFHSLAQWR